MGILNCIHVLHRNIGCATIQFQRKKMCKLAVTPVFLPYIEPRWSATLQLKWKRLMCKLAASLVFLPHINQVGVPPDSWDPKKVRYNLAAVLTFPRYNEPFGVPLLR